MVHSRPGLPTEQGLSGVPASGFTGCGPHSYPDGHRKLPHLKRGPDEVSPQRRPNQIQTAVKSSMGTLGVQSEHQRHGVDWRSHETIVDVELSGVFVQGVHQQSAHTDVLRHCRGAS